MRVQIRRRGGLAGVALRADLDTSELDDESAARVNGAIAQLRSTTRTAPTPQPEAFEYEITVPDRGEPILVGEHEVPNDLRPLIEQLSKTGRVETPRRPPR